MTNEAKRQNAARRMLRPRSQAVEDETETERRQHHRIAQGIMWVCIQKTARAQPPTMYSNISRPGKPTISRLTS